MIRNLKLLRIIRRTGRFFNSYYQLLLNFILQYILSKYSINILYLLIAIILTVHLGMDFFI